MEKYYFSDEIGAVKPDRKIFEHVIHDLGAPPERISFFDDTSVNVQAGRDAGLSAYEVEASRPRTTSTPRHSRLLIRSTPRTAIHAVNRRASSMIRSWVASARDRTPSIAPSCITAMRSERPSSSAFRWRSGDRDPLFDKIADQLVDLRLRAHIDAPCRLVEQQDPASRGQPPGQHHFLLVPSRQVADLLIQRCDPDAQRSPTHRRPSSPPPGRGLRSGRSRRGWSG